MSGFEARYEVSGQIGQTRNPAHVQTRRVVTQYNYQSDAGHGSANFALDQMTAWRRALLGGVAAGALWTIAPRGAAASVTCTWSTSTTGEVVYHCTGPVTGAPPVSVTHTGIAGAAGTQGGVGVDGTVGGRGSSGDVGLSTHIGLTAGGFTSNLSGAAGVFMRSTGGAGGIGGAGGSGYDGSTGGTGGTGGAGGKGGTGASLTLNSAEAITSAGDGILVTSLGGAGGRGGSGGVGGYLYSVVKPGADFAGGSGGDGGTGGAGGDGGSVRITSTGDIHAAGTGISAESRGGSAGTGGSGGAGGESSYYYDGAVNSGPTGANGSAGAAGANSGNGGTVRVYSSGNIAANEGINAASQGVSAGDVKIDVTAGIITAAERGLVASSSANYSGTSGAVQVTVASGVTITTGGTAIDASSFGGPGSGNVTITSGGDITMSGSYRAAISGNSSFGDVTATNNGSVKTTGTSGTGMGVYSSSGNVTANNAGLIDTTAGSGVGISAHSYGGNVTVFNAQTGVITVNNGHGIFASANGSSGPALKIEKFAPVVVTGGSVTVTNDGEISTTGSNASGIYASGSSGDVTVTNSATGMIATAGNYGANGITARISNTNDHCGGPGLSCVAAIAVPMNATATGNIFITNNGKITTSGNFSDAINASNLGSGNVTITSTGDLTASMTSSGGHGIWAYALQGRVSVTSGGKITGNQGIVAISGPYDSNAATDSGGVTIDVSGDIKANESAIFAGSFGGTTGSCCEPGPQTGNTGGRAGAVSVTVRAGTNVSTTANYTSAIGAGSYGGRGQRADSDGATATGGNGGSGDAVSVTNHGRVTTSGNRSAGISAYSVGGKGGYALGYNGDAIGGNGGQAGTVTVTSSGDISTAGNDSAGILAQSLASQGGNAKISGVSDSTARDGARGQSGTVDVTSTGNISTKGARSFGIAAASQTADVSVTTRGTIKTEGIDAHGITATIGSFKNFDTKVSRAPTAKAQADMANPPSVTINNGAAITTSGRSAHGINTYNESGANIVNNTGTIKITGDHAAGINAGTDDASVTVTSSGDITASGKYAAGIAAGSSSGGVANVAVNGGTVTGGSSGVEGVSAAVAFSGGGTGTLTNKGTINAGSGGLAVYGERGVETINNSGTINGDIDLAGGESFLKEANTLNNFAGGLINSGASIKLERDTTTMEIRRPRANAAPASGVFNNAGTLSPGGDGKLQTTALKGNFTQTSTGTFAVDTHWPTGTSDVLTVTGIAELAGKVLPNTLAFPVSNATNKGLTKTFTILTAAGGVTNNGLAVTDTAAVNYELLYPNATTVNLQATIDFTPDDSSNGNGITGQTDNQDSIGENLNGIVQRGGRLPFIPPLLTLTNQNALNNALDQLSPEGDGNSFGSALTMGSAFATHLLSCRVAGEEGDANAVIREGQCVWARANARRFENDGGANKVSYDENGTFFSAGAQVDLGGDWRLGGGIGFENANGNTTSGASSDTDRLHLGAVLKYNPGPWLLAATLTGGHGWADNDRRAAFGNFSAFAKSSTDTDFLSGRFTAAYLATFGNWYLKPQIDVSATHLKRDGYQETATGGIALTVQDNSDTVVAVSPLLELGADLRFAKGGIARPFIRGGLTWLDTDTFTTIASFSGVPAGSLPFAITSSIDDVVANVGVGVDLIDAAGTVLRLQYDGAFGEETTQHGGTAKVSVPF